MPCSPVSGYQSFGGIYHSHLQGDVGNNVQHYLVSQIKWLCYTFSSPWKPQMSVLFTFHMRGILTISWDIVQTDVFEINLFLCMSRLLCIGLFLLSCVSYWRWNSP